MQKINLRRFTADVKQKKKGLKSFITKIESNPPKNLDKTVVNIDKAIWNEIDCLSCANCCKKMTPTFTAKDIKKAATFLKMSPNDFKKKWLNYDEKDDTWVNETQPCQFLDLKTNMCSIYEVRPADCAGFPHLTKKRAVNYIHVHKQNIEYCPATLKFVEMLKEHIQLKNKI